MQTEDRDPEGSEAGIFRAHVRAWLQREAAQPAQRKLECCLYLTGAKAEQLKPMPDAKRCWTGFCTTH